MGDGERPMDGPTEASRRRVRRHARDVALGATLVALVVYLAMCLVADLTVLGHLQDAADARLSTRLQALVLHDAPAPVTPPGGAASPVTPVGPAVSDQDDLDDAPVFAWWVPAGSSVARRLDRDGPALPSPVPAGLGPEDVTIAHRSFRLVEAAIPAGRFVAATSIEELLSIRATLLTAEGAVLPLVLATFFLVAYAIGRRAATPVERARTQQLDFTADASHELRTPLSVIEAEVGLALSAERGAAELRGALERVGVESRRLGGIVEDLLWLARADALPEGRPPAAAVDLAALAEEGIARFEPVAEHRQVALRAADGGLPTAVVQAPADWLDRLLSVLLDNACRYVEPGGEIEVRVGTAAGRSFVSVDDSGPGIAPEELAGVFGRFRRATHAPGGAGLGLSIADTIVRATGGRWEVGRSRSGGARMGVSWPRPSAEDPGPRARTRRSAGQASAGTSR